MSTSHKLSYSTSLHRQVLNVFVGIAALVMPILSRGAEGAVTIDWVTVGNPGNDPDPATGNLYGAVADVFRIMKFEFTNSQYVQFLNAVDPNGTNPNSIYNVSMGSDARAGISFDANANAGSKYATKTNMGNKPVNYVSWFDAARVTNWLHNGGLTYDSTDATASAPQNTGAYTLGTLTSGTAPAMNAGALYWVPSENEWYKAAYYNPTLNSGTGDYTVYSTGLNDPPMPVAATGTGDGTAGPTGNYANFSTGASWNDQAGNVTTVGTNGAASYYGAFDMNGNVWEWNDLTGSAVSSRGARGGGWLDDWTPFGRSLSRSSRITLGPSNENFYHGFRLASPVPVPEPSTWVMSLAGIACGGWRMWRRHRGR
jgi:sulfatase modifying factor 1